MKTPLGIDDANPALSWTIIDARRSVRQTAYRVLVATSEELLAQDQGDLWDSGVVPSDQSHLVTYQGLPLASRARCYWKVLVESAAASAGGVDSTWSPVSWWEMGLLQPEDWEGSWIESPVCRPIDNEATRLWARMCLVPPERNEFKDDPGAARAVRAATQKKLDAVLPAALFRTTFDVPAAVKRARMYLSGLGFHEATAVERLQSQVYHAWSAPFASYLLWYPNLWRKVLEDQRLINRPEPGKDQAFANVVYGNRGGPGWATTAPRRMVISESVTVELPLQLCQRYGDLRQLGLHFPQMKAWLEACVDPATGRLRDGTTAGGWNDHFYRETAADSDFVPSFHDEALMSMLLHRWLRETAAAARLLEKIQDAAELERIAQAVRARINGTWYDPDNKSYGAAEEKETGKIDARYGWHGLMALAVATGVAPEQDAAAILDNCIADMKEHYRGHHAAGHITHQLLYDVYSAHGMIETCYDMMNATGFPSFAYQLQSGNRTIPEGPAWTDRFPAFASACQNECQEPARWFTETLCGVSPDPAEPGFQHVLLRPHIPARLPSASLITTTPYGKLESRWKQEGGHVTWSVRIPPNSDAAAYIPATSAELVRESGRPLSAAAGCTLRGQGAAGVECRLGSGSYQFTFPAPANVPSRLPTARTPAARGPVPHRF